MARAEGGPARRHSRSKDEFSDCPSRRQEGKKSTKGELFLQFGMADVKSFQKLISKIGNFLKAVEEVNEGSERAPQPKRNY